MNTIKREFRIFLDTLLLYGFVVVIVFGSYLVMDYLINYCPYGFTIIYIVSSILIIWFDYMIRQYEDAFDV